MNKRQMLRVVGGGCIAAATPALLSACNSDMPAEAVTAWQPPSDALEWRRWLIAHALLAPHAHNLQSWLVDLRTPDTIVLHMDLARLLPQTDPQARQLVISQGTFVELLDMAARQRGYRADIELFPEGVFGTQAPDARPTARIRLLRDEQVRPDPLFAQIFRRHTDRASYEERVPSPSALQSLSASVMGLPVSLGWVTADHPSVMARHREIAMAAWRTELSTPKVLLETYQWLRIGPSEIAQHRDGLALNTPVARALVALGLFDRSQASAPESLEIKDQLAQFNAHMASTPACLWLSTQDNTRQSQLLAGRAYVRVQLAATAQGLVMHPLSQALQEYPQQAAHHQAIHALLGATESGKTVQMWTRLGHATTATPPSARRALQSFVQSA